QYEHRYKDRLYFLILLSLTHESFREKDAKVLWKGVVHHMKHLYGSLGRHVGISVATLDYLLNVRHELSAPKIIESHKSEFITGTATNDELTGLYLREVFNVVLHKQIEKAKRTRSFVSLLMIDIDDFKQINDTYGHPQGDRVLEKLGDMIRSLVRKMDLPARYGGEEIAVVMPELSIKQAVDVAERIRTKIEELVFDDFSVTVSVRVGQTGKGIDTSEDLIAAADKALYQAKENGKNQVVTSSDS
nr:GGDEF domain-containing protein [Spirochaetales bacterium]